MKHFYNYPFSFHSNIIIFFGLIILLLAVNPSEGDDTNTTVKNYCDTGLSKCRDPMNPLPDAQIPTTSEDIKKACKAFNDGMKCFDTWSDACLAENERDIIRQSVKGAHETFIFLCTEEKFRADFLKNAACYKKISRNLNECINDFYTTMKRLDYRYGRSAEVVCCVKAAYLQCVSHVVHTYCTGTAAKLIGKMAKTLIREPVKEDSCTKTKAETCSSILTQATASTTSMPYFSFSFFDLLFVLFVCHHFH